MRFENISCGLNDGVQEKDGVLLGTVTYMQILHRKITWTSLSFFAPLPPSASQVWLFSSLARFARRKTARLLAVCDNWVFESVTKSANLNRVDHLSRFSL